MSLWRVICAFLGHDETHDDGFSRLGRHYGEATCQRCGRERITWKGPIFPGRADNPEVAVRVIEEIGGREPPEPGDPDWDPITWEEE